MYQGSQIEVLDKEGWRKVFELTKNLIHIGSDARNDIVLDYMRGGGVAPQHLQLIMAPGRPCRLVNLSGSDVIVTSEGGAILGPRLALDISNETTLAVGEFTVTFRGESVLKKSRSNVIGMALTLPTYNLTPGRSTRGSITLSNLGNKAGVQFKLEVEGLPLECYTIGPVPMLYPQASMDIPFALSYDANSNLTAGDYHFSIHASAMEAYPDERASISRVVRILPEYKHRMRIGRVDQHLKL